MYCELFPPQTIPAPDVSPAHVHRRHIDANTLMTTMQNHNALQTSRVTPKLFQYNMRNACLSNPQHVVLPEVGSAACGGLTLFMS